MDLSILRSRARRALSGHWGSAILVTFVAALLGGTGGSGSFAGSSSNNMDLDSWQAMLDRYPVLEQVWHVFLMILPFLAVYTIIVFLVGGMIQLGYCQYCVKLSLGVDGGVSELFAHKGIIWKAFGLQWFTFLKVFLWSLLLVIPGIIAAYRYAMAPYLMAEYPDMGISEAIERSKELMDGHKMDLFLLHLSFIGWAFLCIFTLGIGLLWLNPYMNVSEAEFYLQVTGRGADAEAVG
ncbi:MAG: DUF975 family protein [Lachnospiraceae bacterium]|nr:DUF975 family protein [Lachnospiraceae bacterium]